MDDEERKGKRRELLAWMAEVGVDQGIRDELARRTEAGEAWHTSDAEQQGRWEAMREQWADRTDR